jgi:hypothetical protein
MFPWTSCELPHSIRCSLGITSFIKLHFNLKICLLAISKRHPCTAIDLQPKAILEAKRLSVMRE